MSIEKTHAEIIAEMRNRTDLKGGDMVDNFSLDACFGEYGGWDSLMLIKAYADILEAAHKRDIDRELDKLWKRIGNKTKLREAVERCLAVLKRIDWLGDGVFPNGKFVSPELLARAIQEAEAALGAPPRNCDIGTDNEQIGRWKEFCDHYEVDRSPESFARWAQGPYFEKGGAK